MPKSAKILGPVPRRTPQAPFKNDDRVRKMHTFTCSAEAWEKLERIADAKHAGNRSAALEALILAAPDPSRR